MGASRYVLIAVALLAAGAVTALTMGAFGDSGDPGEVKAAADPGCSSTPFDPDDPGASVLGRVHFPGYVTPGWKQGDKLQSDPRGGRTKFAKQALLVRGDDPVVVRVPRRSRRSVDLAGWGSNTVRFRADRIKIDLGKSGTCEGGWPGGFFFTRKQCLHLRVAAADRRASVPFGLGKACS